ncbi:MAG: YceI family protein [Chthoniobacteraceae bacterium]|jgi:polyisoprenoid-binding protein YceI
MKMITRTELKDLLDKGGPHTLIDVTPAEYYEAAHLPGAKNCCVYEVTFLDQVASAAPQGTIIVYGSSRHSLASATAQEKLTRAGYAEALNYRGGLEDWEAGGLPVVRGPQPPPDPQPREGRHEVDTAKSRVLWTGRNIHSQHTGTIKLKSGWIDVGDCSSATGEFTLDMESIADTDLENSSLKGILIAHLKSDDFFDTKQFPTAVFHLRHVVINPHAKPGSINAEVDGTLTLKGVTDGLGFPAIIEALPGGELSAEAHFDIDRTRWNVLYGSGKFYEKLGRNLVHDNISLSLHIVTN